MSRTRGYGVGLINDNLTIDWIFMRSGEYWLLYIIKFVNIKIKNYLFLKIENIIMALNIDFTRIFLVEDYKI